VKLAAQIADVNIDRSFQWAAPVEPGYLSNQLLTREHPSRGAHQQREQFILNAGKDYLVACCTQPPLIYVQLHLPPPKKRLGGLTVTLNPAQNSPGSGKQFLGVEWDLEAVVGSGGESQDLSEFIRTVIEQYDGGIIALPAQHSAELEAIDKR
jgi:hypothetical protein